MQFGLFLFLISQVSSTPVVQTRAGSNSITDNETNENDMRPEEILTQMKRGKYVHFYKDSPDISPERKNIIVPSRIPSLESQSTMEDLESILPQIPQNNTANINIIQPESQLLSNFSSHLYSAMKHFERKFIPSHRKYINYTLNARLPSFNFPPLQHFYQTLTLEQKKKYFLIASTLHNSLFNNEYQTLHNTFNTMSTPNQIQAVTLLYNGNSTISKTQVLMLLSPHQRKLFAHIYGRNIVIRDFLMSLALGLYVTLVRGQIQLIPFRGVVGEFYEEECVADDGFLREMNEKKKVDHRMGVVTEEVRKLLYGLSQRTAIITNK